MDRVGDHRSPALYFKIKFKGGYQMIILLSLLLIAFVLIVLGVIGDKNWGWVDATGACHFVALILILTNIIALIYLPITRREDRVFVEQVKATRITLNSFRKKEYNFDRATIAKDIVDVNKKIAELKYDNRSFWWWDWWTDDSVDELKLIKYCEITKQVLKDELRQIKTDKRNEGKGMTY